MEFLKVGLSESLECRPSSDAKAGSGGAMDRLGSAKSRTMTEPARANLARATKQPAQPPISASDRVGLGFCFFSWNCRRDKGLAAPQARQVPGSRTRHPLLPPPRPRTRREHGTLATPLQQASHPPSPQRRAGNFRQTATKRPRAAARRAGRSGWRALGVGGCRWEHRKANGQGKCGEMGLLSARGLGCASSGRGCKSSGAKHEAVLSAMATKSAEWRPSAGRKQRWRWVVGLPQVMQNVQAVTEWRLMPPGGLVRLQAQRSANGPPSGGEGLRGPKGEAKANLDRV
jgi:hypothetical protein